MGLRFHMAAGAALAALAAVSTAGGAAAQDATIAFSCGTGGVSFAVEIDPERGQGLFTGPAYQAPLVPNQRGAWVNEDREIQFYPESLPPELFLGSEQFSCDHAEAGAPPAGGAVPVDAAGRSLGGRLREGPGTHFPAVGILVEGTSVTLVANTGVDLDGYDWFEIRTPQGVSAYQWGGILCSEGRLVPGVYQVC